MMEIRKSEERGAVRLSWLDTKHTFSFGDYYDPKHMGWGDLRVINDDIIMAKGGFGSHPHRDMEIISYMVDGVIEHIDSMGNAEQVKAGEVQRMTAGRGVQHSEINPSLTDKLRLIQIWIQPEAYGLDPDYEQKAFTAADKRGRLLPIVNRGGTDGALHLNQDAALYATVLQDGEEVSHALGAGRKAWVQVVRGTLTVNGERLNEGDGAALADVDRVTLTGPETGGEALLFDLK